MARFIRLPAGTLFELVWSMPLPAVSEQLSAPVREIKRACDAAGVARPTTGFWNHDQRRRAELQPPTPVGKDALREVRIDTGFKSATDKSLDRKSIKKLNNIFADNDLINIDYNLKNSNQIILGWINQSKNSKIVRSSKLNYPRRSNGQFTSRNLTEFDRYRFFITGVLIDHMESNGFEIRRTCPTGKLWCVVNGSPIEATARWMLRAATDVEGQTQRTWTAIPPPGLARQLPTGSLRFAAKHPGDEKPFFTVSEAAPGGTAAAIDEFVRVVLNNTQSITEVRADALLEKQTRPQQSLAPQEDPTDPVEFSLSGLQEAASQHRKSEDLRKFIQLLEAEAEATNLSDSARSRLQSLIRFAHQQADELDPLRTGVDSLLEKIMKR